MFYCFYARNILYIFAGRFWQGYKIISPMCCLPSSWWWCPYYLFLWPYWQWASEFALVVRPSLRAFSAWTESRRLSQAYTTQPMWNLLRSSSWPATLWVWLYFGKNTSLHSVWYIAAVSLDYCSSWCSFFGWLPLRFVLRFVPAFTLAWWSLRSEEPASLVDKIQVVYPRFYS